MTELIKEGVQFRWLTCFGTELCLVREEISVSASGNTGTSALELFCQVAKDVTRA